jgi:hypothetical protein
VTPGAVNRPNQVPDTDTVVLVQFCTVRVAVERPPGLTVEGSKMKLATWTVPVQAAGSAADLVLALAAAPPITTDMIAAAVRSTPTNLRICDSSSTCYGVEERLFPASWVGGHPLTMDDVDSMEFPVSTSVASVSSEWNGSDSPRVHRPRPRRHPAACGRSSSLDRRRYPIKSMPVEVVPTEEVISGLTGDRSRPWRPKGHLDVEVSADPERFKRVIRGAGDRLGGALICRGSALWLANDRDVL